MSPPETLTDTILAALDAEGFTDHADCENGCTARGQEIESAQEIAARAWAVMEGELGAP